MFKNLSVESKPMYCGCSSGAAGGDAASGDGGGDSGGGSEDNMDDATNTGLGQVGEQAGEPGGYSMDSLGNISTESDMGGSDSDTDAGATTAGFVSASLQAQTNGRLGTGRDPGKSWSETREDIRSEQVDSRDRSLAVDQNREAEWSEADGVGDYSRYAVSRAVDHVTENPISTIAMFANPASIAAKLGISALARAADSKVRGETNEEALESASFGLAKDTTKAVTGRLGASIGSSLGPYGAMVGGIAGSKLGGAMADQARSEAGNTGVTGSTGSTGSTGVTGNYAGDYGSDDSPASGGLLSSVPLAAAPEQDLYATAGVQRGANRSSINRSGINRSSMNRGGLNRSTRVRG